MLPRKTTGPPTAILLQRHVTSDGVADDYDGRQGPVRVCNNLFCVITKVCTSFHTEHVNEQLPVTWPRWVLVLMEFVRAHYINQLLVRRWLWPHVVVVGGGNHDMNAA